MNNPDSPDTIPNPDTIAPLVDAITAPLVKSISSVPLLSFLALLALLAYWSRA